MIHIVGEILVDIFKDKDASLIFPGGAPFNIASNISHFDGRVSFYGAVGKDEYGKFLKKFCKKTNINPLILKSLNTKETTKAIVSLSNGERSFHFERENGADYALSIKCLERLNIQEGDIFHIGSLMLSFPRGKRFFFKAIEYAKSKGALISFDINYRDDIFESTTHAIRIFKKAISKADIVKASDEELKQLTHLVKFETAAKKLFNENQIAFISLGSKGSCLFKSNKFIYQNSVKVKPIDTTGAGDAFYSRVLYELDNYKGDLNNAEVVKSILYKANIVGAVATLKKGAVNVAPNDQEIEQYLSNNKDIQN